MPDRPTATLPQARRRGRPESTMLEPAAPRPGVYDWADEALGRPPRRRSHLAPFRRHPIRTGIALALAVLLSIVGWSYGHALTAPGTDSVASRSVEWVRDHGGSSLVNWIEREWYTHHQPPKGGAPKPGLIPAAVPTTAAPPPARKGAPVVPHLPPPEPMVPLAVPPLPGEGTWRPVGSPVKGLPAMYATDVRPDPVHTSLVTGVAWMDTKLLRAVQYSGTVEPGGTWQNMAPIQSLLRPSLLAAFNSGFRLQDSQGGYYTEGRYAKPLVNGSASFVIRTDGTATVAKWGRDATLGPDIATVRQNLALIVDGGDPVPGLQNDANVLWGKTSGNRTLVWRSGVGVTATGALVYAGGNGLSVYSLATVLAHAGAVRAMEMDINQPSTDFFYWTSPPGQPATPDTGAKLVPDMASTTARYLSPSQRDFVAMFAR